MEPKPSQDGIQAATTIFQSLVSIRLTDRYKAIEFLNDPRNSIDLATLRSFLIKAINQDYRVGKEDELDDPEIAITRSWLLGALARISAGDNKATKLVTRHIEDGYETYRWGRYWALEGFITGKNGAAEAVSRSVAGDNDLLVGMLATAFLASLNDPPCTERIKKSLESEKNKWSALRALRIVPLPSTIPALCKLVEEAGYTDATYDAIIALGKVPHHWSQSPMAAQALATCIIKMRGSPWKDSMRTSAITSLGNLKVESSAPLIIEELADNNPAVVREAARSIEKVLGLRLTAIRVVEAASKSDAAGMDTYALALRWLNREAVAEELETLMTSGTGKQQEVARTLMSELGGTVAFEKLRARTDAVKQYTAIFKETEDKIRELFEASVHEAQSGFQVAVIMDVIVFGVGILLLLSSAGYILFTTGDLTNWVGIGVSGGLGVLGVVYGVLISNPRRQVRESVNHLMLVKIMFLAYLRRLHQADQAYTRRLLDDEPMTVEQVKPFTDMVGSIMNDTVQLQLKGSSIDPGKGDPKGRIQSASDQLAKIVQQDSKGDNPVNEAPTQPGQS